MKIGRSYKQHGIEGSYDAIVIGSGIGGLTAAALLAKHGGKKVLVLERHYTAGGFTHSFSRPGYEWDVGVHYIGQTQPRTLLRRAFDELSDGQLAWADIGDGYDTIVVGDERYPFPAGRERWRQAMHGWFPREHAAIDRYIELIRESARDSQLFFAEKVLPRPLSGTVGGVLRRKAMRLARRTTREVLSELTSDERLIGVLTGQYGDYGLPPAESSFFMHALVVNHYMGGGAYPVGGASRIAETIIPVIERAGGAVLVSAEVTKVLIEKNRAHGVELADGTCVYAPQVISDAGVMNTFARLVPAEDADRHGFDRQLAELEPSVAHASLYLGFRQTAAELGLRKNNLWVYPDYNHDRNVERFLHDKAAPLPVAYLSFPSAKDPDFENRHPGRATVEVVTLAPYRWFAEWQDTRWKKRGAEYEQLKKDLSERMLAPLLAQYPQLAGQIDHCELSSPLTTRHFAHFSRGEIYGVSHTPQRFEQRWLRPATPVKGLYLTGADVCSAGVGGALFGGVLTASSILRKNLINVIARRPPAAEASAEPVRAAA
ncbi:phytoene desaturase family protein [Haliangium ochraceum]|uniref:All-trans-retinol 13,14-reductase n=1 Tax=Haliangium ochraceum (strain DSM 14365 / JCM 11303 / SMP-2) TaxID=502025 RepID=D0LR10_HALO1|nr:NAD(P)/FAD-dependent oxidoreductase [Haliangium ochraceum]ACY15518.1 All-trans-retinol 13,14-reductase [Haliangium ochraceum DSM 14365]